MPKNAGGFGTEALPSFFESLYVNLTADANEICEGIFLGSAPAAEDKNAMRKRRISHVLIAHPMLPEKFPTHFKYRRAPIIDEPTANLLEQLPDALEYLVSARKSGGRVFVYCMKGISRSSSIIMALLMLERSVSFDEAFQICEKRRPVVYPNIGFQRQLRFFEGLLKQGDHSAPVDEKVRRLRDCMPTGELEGPGSALQIRSAIGDTLDEELSKVESLVDKVLMQPALLQQRELWKRQGLFFENLHKYKALPKSPELLIRAKTACERLQSLPKIFSESLKGVKLGLAVAKEIHSWVSFAEPILSKMPGAGEENVETCAQQEAEPDVRSTGGGNDQSSDESDPCASEIAKNVAKRHKPNTDGSKKHIENSSESDSDSSMSAAKKRKQKSKKEKKKNKKEVKKKKKEKKLQRLVEKEAKKAGKQAAKMEKAAREAERFAQDSRKEAEIARDKALTAEVELATFEKQQKKLAEQEANAAQTDDWMPPFRMQSSRGGISSRHRCERSESVSSGSPHRKTKHREAPRRPPAADAYDDL